MNEIVKTYGLTKTYGDTTVVNNLDLNVAQERIYGFLGPNGHYFKNAPGTRKAVERRDRYIREEI